MKLYELMTGVIAAVLIALGAYQYVNRATVEEEPVAKKEIKRLADEQWFILDVSGAIDQDNSSQQIITGMYPGQADDQNDGPCPDNAGTICAVKLDVEELDLENYDFESGTVTVEELDIDGADIITYAHREE